YAFTENQVDLRGPWNVDIKMKQEKNSLIVETLKLRGGAGSLVASARLPMAFAPLAEAEKFMVQPAEPFEAALSVPRCDLRLHDGAVSPVSAEASFKGPLRYPEGCFTVHAAPLAVGLADPMDLAFDGALDKGWLSLKKLSLSRAGNKVISGTAALNLNGEDPLSLTLPGPGTELNLSLNVKDEDLAHYVDRFNMPVTGRGSLQLDGTGTLADPRYFLSLALDDCFLCALPVEGEPVLPAPPEVMFPFRFKGSFEAGAKGLEAKQLLLESLTGRLTGSARFPLCLDHDSIMSGRIYNACSPVDGNLTFSGLDLASINDYVPQIRRLKGILSGSLVLSGSPESLGFQGDLTLTRGACRIQSQVPSLEEIEAEIHMSPEAIVIKHLQGEMGSSPFSLEGSISLSDLKPAAFDLALTSRNALLYRGSGLRLRADLDLAVNGPVTQPRVSGDVFIVDSRFVRTLSLIPEKGPPPIDEPIKPFSLTEPVFRDLLFDVAITTRDPKDLFIDNNVGHGGVRLDLALKGTGLEPYFLGTAVFDDLLIKLPNFKFFVDTGTLVFPESNPYEPYIRCLASGRRQSIDVSLLVEGPVTDPDIYLTSNPPLDYDELVLLVASGVFPTGSHAAAQLGTYLGEELYNRFFATESTEAGASPLEKLELNFGTEVGSDGTENFIVEYSVNGPWHIQVEQDIYKDWNTGVVYRIRFR
ncbi:MAG: translocation/assembly module TamB domain-containing protein, partial [Planctomycetota bacterium]